MGRNFLKLIFFLLDLRFFFIFLIFCLSGFNLSDFRMLGIWVLLIFLFFILLKRLKVFLNFRICFFVRFVIVFFLLFVLCLRIILWYVIECCLGIY